MKGWGPVLAVIGSGAVLLLFGAAASTDTGTVGGVALGGAILGAGGMLAFDTAKARRDARRALRVSDHTVRSIERREGGNRHA